MSLVIIKSKLPGKDAPKPKPIQINTICKVRKIIFTSKVFLKAIYKQHVTSAPRSDRHSNKISDIRTYGRTDNL